jgi:hypothetical protein
MRAEEGAGMQDWVAGSMAVLGTLLVLAGATLIVVRTIATNEEAPDTDPAAPAAPQRPAPDRPAPDRAADPLAEPATVAEPAPARRRWRLLPLRQMGPANQLIAWGVVLLIIAALAVGAITFNISAAVGTQ